MIIQTIHQFCKILQESSIHFRKFPSISIPPFPAMFAPYALPWLCLVLQGAHCSQDLLHVSGLRKRSCQFWTILGNFGQGKNGKIWEKWGKMGEHLEKWEKSHIWRPRCGTTLIERSGGIASCKKEHVVLQHPSTANLQPVQPT